jgi:hypothetical protein
MQCPMCGRQNRPGALVCDQCRTPLSQENPGRNALPAPVRLSKSNAAPGGQGWEPSPAPPLSSSMLLGQAGQQLAITPPVARADSHEGFQGVAHVIQQRTESNGPRTSTIMSFRLEQFDQMSGDRTRVIPVELRGLSIAGIINDGDKVTVFGRVKEGLLRAKRVDNSTTGGMVEVAGTPADTRSVGVLFILVAAVFLMVWLVIAVAIATQIIPHVP